MEGSEQDVQEKDFQTSTMTLTSKAANGRPLTSSRDVTGVLHGLWSKVSHVIRQVTLEPVLLLNTTANALQMIVIQSLFIHKSCLMDVGLDAPLTTDEQEARCDNLTADGALHEQYVTSTANYQVYRSCLDLGPGVLLTLFLGSWSDKHGRKLLILVPLIGDTLCCALYAIFSYFMNTTPYALLIGSAIQGITGGDLLFHVAINSFIIEGSSLESRTTRVAIIDVSLMLGALMGVMAGGVLLARLGYVTVFLVAFLLDAIALGYLAFRLRGTPLVQVSSDGSGRSLKDAFHLTNVRQAFHVITRKRPGRNRIYMMTLLVAKILLIFPMIGGRNLGYLYTRTKFHWSVQQHSFYAACHIAAICFGSVFLLPFLSFVLKIPDTLVGTLACILNVGSDVICALATSGLAMFLAIIPHTLAGATGIVGKSLLTKCVDNTELGGLLSVLGSFLASSPFVAGYFYTLLFNATINTFLGAHYILSAGFLLVSCSLFLWIHIDLNCTKKDDDVGEQQKAAGSETKTSIKNDAQETQQQQHTDSTKL